jgi:hypothetical protein
MAVAMFMNWPGVTKEQYEAVLHELNLDRNPPAGGLFHISVLLPTGLRVVDLWESAESFNKFSETRIAAAVKKVGITTQPTVEIHPAHNVYAPGMSTIGALGASSLPR